MTVTVTLPSAVANLLREKAIKSGSTLSAYLVQLAEKDAQTNEAVLAALPQNVSSEEFDRLLDELSDGPELPHLPVDFSRADIYADHD